LLREPPFYTLVLLLFVVVVVVVAVNGRSNQTLRVPPKAAPGRCRFFAYHSELHHRRRAKHAAPSWNDSENNITRRRCDGTEFIRHDRAPEINVRAFSTNNWIIHTLYQRNEFENGNRNDSNVWNKNKNRMYEETKNRNKKHVFEHLYLSSNLFRRINYTWINLEIWTIFLSN